MVLRIDENGPFETTNGGKRVSTPTVELGQQAEDGGFSGFRAELNIMFRAVVEAALGVFEIPMLKEALPHLAVGHSQALLVADRPVIGKGLVERFNCVLPALFSGLLKRQVVIEDAERPEMQHEEGGKGRIVGYPVRRDQRSLSIELAGGRPVEVALP